MSGYWKGWRARNERLVWGGPPTNRRPLQWPNNLLPFRPPGGRPRHPVKGGRWMVRKNPHRWVKGEPAWRAWTTGKLKPFSRWFHTQQEAIEWATWCARTRQQLPPDQAEQAIREGKKWGEYYQKFIRPKTVV